MSVIQRIPRYLVRAVSAGAVVVAAALPLAAASAASAATAPTLSSVTTSNSTGGTGNYFGSGASGTMTITGANFANDGGNVTVTSNAPGLTFSGAAETGAGTATVSFSSTSATVAGFYNLTLTDNAGTATLNNAFYVNSAPTITSISPATIVQGQTVTLTVSGSGFNNAMGSGAFGVTFSSATDGTPLTVGSITSVTATSFNVSVSALNPNTQVASPGSVTAGAFNATVTNSDGGNSTASNVLNVTAFGLTSASPTYIPGTSASATSTTTVTLSGQNLGSGGALTGIVHGTTTSINTWIGVPTFTNTSITFPLTVPVSTTGVTLDFTFTSSSGAQSTLAGAIGVGTSPTNPASAPTVTSVGGATSLGIGSAATLIITGTNFVPGATTPEIDATGFGPGAANPGLSAACAATVNVISTTQALCTIGSGAITASTIAGGQDVFMTTAAGTGAATSAFSITGPVITAVSPAVLGVGSGSGTTLTLTGTGFPTTGTTTATFTGVTGGPLTATVTVSSATSATVALPANVSANPVTIKLTNPGSTTSPVFSISAGTAVTLTGIAYATGTTGVGQGASGISVTVTGTGLLPGVALSFPAASGITASVTSVTSTSVVAKVSVPSTTAAGTYAITATNTNGGTGGGVNLTVTAGPGGTSALSASPSATILSGQSATLTLTPGTAGAFEAGATVTSSNSLLTVGTVVVNSATSLSVPLTAVAITGTSPIVVNLTVINPDGGNASITITINMGPTVTGSYYVPTFSTNVQVIVTGTGFENGMTVSSSNSDYKVILGQVNPASGTSVTSTAILVVTTTSNATAGTSSDVTFTNPDGGKVTFKLNGGPAPTPVVVKPFKVIRCVGYALTGTTRTMTILGTGFYGQPRVTSSVGGVRVGVVHDSGSALTIRVTTSARTPRGIHVFTVTLANGKSASLKYNQR